MKLFLKITIVTVILLLVTNSCKKGKILPETVYVSIDTTQTYIYISDEEYDEFGYPVHHEYIGGQTKDGLRQTLYEELSDYLSRNNCVVNDSLSTYTIRVDRISLNESYSSESYLDSCSFDIWEDYTTSYIKVYELSYSSEITIQDDTGSEIGTTDARVRKKERTRIKRDDCGAPKKWGIFCEDGCMQNRVHKKLRKYITKRIYSHMNG